MALLDQELCELWVVLDHQDDLVAVREVLTVIIYRALRARRTRNSELGTRRSRPVSSLRSAFCRSAFPVPSSAFGEFRVPRSPLPAPRSPSRVHGKIDGEGGTLPLLALQLDFASQQARQFSGDGEAQTGAAEFPRGAALGLLEGLENPLLMLRRDPGSRIAHGNRNRILGPQPAPGQVGVPARPGEFHGHATLCGELDRIRQEVPDDLLEALAVLAESRGRVLAAMNLQGEALLFRQMLEAAPQAAFELVEIKLLEQHIHLARLDLG